MISSALSFFENSDDPIVRIIFIILIIIPLLYNFFSRFLPFYNENIKHLKAKNIEQALSKLKENSDEYYLLEECKVQELIYVNTKLSLSALERPIVIDWLRNKPVTIELIKKAWPQIVFEEGNLNPRLSKYEKIFMLYSLLVMIGLSAYGTIILDALIKQASYKDLLIPLFYYFLAFLMFKQSEPMFSAQKLINRLK